MLPNEHSANQSKLNEIERLRKALTPGRWRLSRANNEPFLIVDVTDYQDGVRRDVIPPLPRIERVGVGESIVPPKFATGFYKKIKMKNLTIDEILDEDTVKHLVDQVGDEVDLMEALLVISRDKSGEVHYHTNCHRSEALGMCDIVHEMILHKKDY